MASKTAAPGLYPRQLVIMVTDDVGKYVDDVAAKHRVSKSEVARTLIDAGIEVGQAAAIPRAELIAIFQKAWHAADEGGAVGHRTEAGLDAVLARIL